ncbi:AAA family ATPase [Pseudonocardia abyssalis]|uniref:AAA family ATPase n=1 Tax=Pseudonocardia abyssalis TaxID=2792008 RepID=A0ABS6UKF4_9PSEU|nr:AAA family ATPase [Pseudonocardia abyssalis]MBW0117099.1 AAA family ATPase [Pseudonocardia abyssalis]MBW0132728.1 AAA family ATPase [Pseudonocardia abyssalis]
MRVVLPGRALVLVAGMPGAGKSTLLASLPRDPQVAVLDSDTQRAAMRRLLPGVRYRYYRWLVHLLHRLAVLRAACSAVAVVVVHLPATDPTSRAVLARLAALTGRAAHLLWLHVDAADARRGQRTRGRVVSHGSFSAHAARAASTTAALRDGPAGGWTKVRILDRTAAAGGLRLVHGTCPPRRVVLDAGAPPRRARPR